MAASHEMEKPSGFDSQVQEIRTKKSERQGREPLLNFYLRFIFNLTESARVAGAM